MVIATPSFILSGFTWPLSQMPDWVVAVANVIPLTHFLQAFRILLIEEGTLSQCSGAIWAMIWIGLVCAVLSYVALYFKRKKVLKSSPFIRVILLLGGSVVTALRIIYAN